MQVFQIPYLFASSPVAWEFMKSPFVREMNEDMRKATGIVPGPQGSTAEIAVTVFPGSVGGLAANVNRWRGQVSLPPSSPDEIAASAQAAKVGGIESQRFVMTSPDGKTSLDAFMTPKDGATWFFKMKGDAAAVEANAAAFAAFLSASKLP